MPRHEPRASAQGAPPPHAPFRHEPTSLREVRLRPASVVLARGVPAPEQSLSGFGGPLLDARRGPAEIVLDMDREVVGSLAAQITVLRPAQLAVRYGEALCQVLGPPAGQTDPMTEDVFTRGGGPWVLRSSGRRAFRYVHLSVTQGALALENLWAHHWEHAAARRGQFSCSDPLLNRIWTLCADTLATCTRQLIEDAPVRGPAASAQALRLAQLASLMTNGNPAPARATWAALIAAGGHDSDILRLVAQEQGLYTGAADAMCEASVAFDKGDTSADAPPAPDSGLAAAQACAAHWEAGRAEAALAKLRAFWGGLLGAGAVAAWEAFDPTRAEAYAQDASLIRCHAGSTGPAYLLPRYLLGVAPAAPGFAQVHLRPQLADLTWAQGAVPTPHGAIWVHWETVPHLHGHVSLPKGVRAQVFWRPDAAAPALELGSGEHDIAEPTRSAGDERP